MKKEIVLFSLVKKYRVVITTLCAAVFLIASIASFAFYTMSSSARAKQDKAASLLHVDLEQIDSGLGLYQYQGDSKLIDSSLLAFDQAKRDLASLIAANNGKDLKDVDRSLDKAIANINSARKVSLSADSQYSIIDSARNNEASVYENVDPLLKMPEMPEIVGYTTKKIASDTKKIAGDTKSDFVLLSSVLHSINLNILAGIGSVQGMIAVAPAVKAETDQITPIYDRLKVSPNEGVQHALPAIASTIEGSLSFNKAVESVDRSASLVRLAQEDVRKVKADFSKSGSVVKVDDAGSALLIFSIVMGVSLLVAAGLLVKFSRDEEIVRDKKIEEGNQDLELSILQLIDDLKAISGGDLSVTAYVSENITGVVADSLNDTISKIRGIVGSIIGSAENINIAAQKSVEAYDRLNGSVEDQVKGIGDTGGLVDMVVTSIHDVNASASESAAVAVRAKEAAARGYQAVKDTIEGMNTIREHIQDTSKRIKRLGESSQEIGDIVALVSSIADQTNVLALNAALQAVSAGEAGRGFAIVAEEVQRLAERSAAASQQIASLVKLIQNDAHDAIISMEKSTSGVVAGARMSDVSGESLREIEETTSNLAGLIESISVSTLVQTEMSSEATSSMKQMLSVTERSKDEAGLMRESVEAIVDRADGLAKSVAGFKV